MIKGKRVSLRRVEPADYASILRWQNDPVVFYLMDYVTPFAAEDIVASEQNAIREGHPFIVEVEGKPIGRIGLNNFRWRDRVASLYVFIGEPQEWGKGYGADALETILGYGFDSLNLSLIDLWTLADNDRAIKLYMGAGFVEEGRLRDRSFKRGTYVDHIVMSITREEFMRARRP
jgi:RimJ/RimL family protein N-acetyltransferase